MRKVKAIIERAGDGTYSVYMDADDMSYLITGTGETAEGAIKSFQINYDDMKRYYAEEGKEFEEVDFVYEYDIILFGRIIQDYRSKSRTVKSLSYRSSYTFRSHQAKNPRFHPCICRRIK